jgi:hypothetical protein
MAIKNITVPVDQLSYDSALITWETDVGEERTYDGVRYGIGALYQDTGEILDADGDTAHSILLTGLQPGTTYQAQPHSRLDGSRSPLPYENESANGIVSFTTLDEPVIQPGVVSRLTLTADKHLVRAGQAVRLTIKASGSGGSLAGKPIALAARSGPRLDPRGTFSPADPVTGPDPDNRCEVIYTPQRRGLVWITAKVDGVCARLKLIVRR